MSSDLMLTPAEREAASQKAAAAAAATDEGELFASAKEMVIGEGEGQHIVVIGAGLVGSMAAVVLARKGFKVQVFERYPDIRSIPGLGRSINLSVTSRGLRAVRALGGGIYDQILEELCTRVRGRIIHMPGGEVLFQRYGRDDSECNYSVSRLDLNKFLINLAVQQGVEFHFDYMLSESSDFLSGGAVGCTLHFTRAVASGAARERSADGSVGGETERVRVKVLCPVIACDGAGSRTRRSLQRQGLTTYTEDLIPRGYKEVLFPNPGANDFGAKGEAGGEPCEGRYGLHIWPRGEHMLMALSNRDGSFTGTIYIDNHGPDASFEAFSNTEEGRARCRAFCEKYYAEAIPLVGGIDEMVRQITENPTGLLGTVAATKWAIQGKVILIGDASHAMCPFFGQGCNCGFEDTLWLSKLLDQHVCRDGKVAPELCTPENFVTVFAELEKERKPNADAICAMALENFVEMCDKTGDTRFQAQKRVENKLENAFPELIRSRYAMVCYGGEGNVTYANAKHLGVIQEEILTQLCSKFQDAESLADAANKVDLDEARALVQEKLVPVQRELGIDLSTVRH